MQTGEIWKFDDDVLDIYALPNTPATLQPYEIPVPTAEQLLDDANAIAWKYQQARAQIALDASDVTVLRCVEKAIVVPAEWSAYRTSLRIIVGAATVGDPAQPLPTMPIYPAGT